MFFKNDKAVSPVVATLVLVVVAIIGAAAVGALLGAFSSDVTNEASAGDSASASSTELTIAGSTTVQPVSEVLAEAFMAANKGVKVSVGGGGSSAGIAGAELDSVDIGASSKDVDVVIDHPTLKKFQIGGRGVVMIANIAGADRISKEAAYKIYDTCVDGKVAITPASGAITANGVTAGTTVTVYQRAEGSGTEEAVATWIGKGGTHAFSDDKDLDASTALGANGNQGMVNLVGSTDTIGFCDYGFVSKLSGGATELDICADDGSALYTADGNAIKATLQGKDEYPKELVSPLIYLTKGQPNTIEQAFINFARSPASAEYFHDVGVYHVTEL